MNPPIPANELERLAALRSLNILDTPSEPAYDDLTKLAAFVCDAPMASISLIDEDRQWFKSKIGIDMPGTPRSISFCGHAINQDDLFVVEDATKDTRFRENPLVLDTPGIRFYAGMPITSPDGFNVGTLCVLDREPRELTEEKKVALRVLARQVASHFQIRQQLEALRDIQAKRIKVEQKLRESQAKLKEANARLMELVTTDPLTGVSNRRAFDEQLQNLWKLSARSQSPLSLLMLDVDHFKKINDTFGHEAGDEVLRQVARTLKHATRSTDVTARYGGEEFAILLPSTPLDAAALFAEHLRETIASLPWEGAALTISIGAASDTASSSGRGICRLVQHADAALYEAKRSGRNRVVRFSKEMIAQEIVSAMV
jgi:diguanylate cyclase (GGDEF)-like protein